MYDFSAISDCLSSNKKIVSECRKALEVTQNRLDERFYADEDIELLITERAVFIDEILKLSWSYFTWNQNLKSWRKKRVALLAVGGYGRKELHPHSDIDLLILLERNSYSLHKQNIESFIALLWDIGLKVGHSVRSVSECKVQANLDVTILTALMESRTIVGDDELRLDMLKGIRPQRIWSPKAFYQAKKDEQEERHQKFNHTEFSLEPNVKTSPGGLRDIQTVMWIARRKFGAVTINDLVERNFLTWDESQILKESRKLLWKIRYGLHLISGRSDDRLLFEYQQKLSSLFGYKDNTMLAVEQFMQDYYRSALELYATNELLLQYFDEIILRGSEKVKHIQLNSRFKTHNDYIEVTHDKVFEEHPPALLEMFVLIGNSDDIEGIRTSTIRLARKSAGLIDDSFREHPQTTAYFLELLKSSSRLFSQLRRMARYGILGAYLPEFGRVIGQMQFDLFHIYTVDAHTLQVIRNMRRFRYRNEEQRFPIAAHIHPRLPKIEILYIAALYHDIAKGLTGDHSQRGISIAAEFCRRHKMGQWDTNLVCWLVENHLTMSSTAQRKDILDPDVIYEFSMLVQDQVRLDYLYALTVADITATNPTLWNSWRASLMHQLYYETKKFLKQGLGHTVDINVYIEETQNSVKQKLAERGIDAEEVDSIWKNIDDDYFIKESSQDIVWHTQTIFEQRGRDHPLVQVRDIHSRLGDEGATQIFVYTRMESRVFLAIVMAIDELGLDIVDARITTTDTHQVLDTFIVLEPEGKPVGDDVDRVRRIRRTIRDRLEGREPRHPAAKKRTPRSLRQFIVETQVAITDDPFNRYSVLEVVTSDRPGLLAVIAKVFVELNIHVHSAKIATLGERVEDIFYVVDKNELPIENPQVREKLTDRLCQELDKHVNPTINSQEKL